MRQPVHVVYGGANLFKPDISARLGKVASTAAAQYGPIDEVLGVSSGVAARVLEKLHSEPVEDYRIDFEDGYGYRTDAEEDGHAVSAAHMLREGLAAGVLPPYIGMRIKPLTAELRERAARTLDLFLRELGTQIPPGFCVTLPKISRPEQVAELATRLDSLESETGIAPGSIAVELMIETPQCFTSDNLLKFHAAGHGRVRGAHFGPFDYTASIGIAANEQDLLHPACDMARHMMQISFVPEGVWLSDGPTNVMPVARERGAEGVRDAWRLHYRNVRHALRMGYYQGWDLHPAQLVSRFAAVYSFYDEASAEASARLKNFVDRAAQASMVGQKFDDAATGQGLLNFFLRAIQCGAMTETDVLQRTGLTHSQIAAASFAAIVAGTR